MTEELLSARADASEAFCPALPDRREKNPPPPPPAPPPPPKPPPANPGAVVVVVDAVAVVVATPTVRSTTMSVPTDDNGDSTLVWALDSPLDTPMIPMTRPTPAARPRAVTRVRLHRRHSSCHT